MQIISKRVNLKTILWRGYNLNNSLWINRYAEKSGSSLNLNDLTDFILKKANGRKRFLVAIAGPPASGKSTLASKLCKKIDLRNTDANPIVVPMDGFHLDNSVLDELGLRDRKGAINTFDAKGFVDLITSIHTNEGDVKIPEFDRAEDRVVQSKKSVTEANKIIIVEGNYLLVEEAPWDDLMQYFDLPIFLLPKTADIENRLLQRWLDYGYSLDDAKIKAYSNDIPNAKFVLANSAYVDLTFEEIELE